MFSVWLHTVGKVTFQFQSVLLLTFSLLSAPFFNLHFLDALNVCAMTLPWPTVIMLSQFCTWSWTKVKDALILLTAHILFQQNSVMQHVFLGDFSVLKLFGALLIIITHPSPFYAWQMNQRKPYDFLLCWGEVKFTLKTAAVHTSCKARGMT